MGVDGETRVQGESRGAVAEVKGSGAEIGVLQGLQHAGARRGIRTEAKRGVVEGKQGHGEKGGLRKGRWIDSGDPGITGVGGWHGSWGEGLA